MATEGSKFKVLCQQVTLLDYLAAYIEKFKKNCYYNNEGMSKKILLKNNEFYKTAMVSTKK